MKAKIICSKCKKDLKISNDGYYTNVWNYDKAEKLFCLDTKEIQSAPYCLNCGSILAINVLSKIGMKHIFKKRQKALGTKFYEAYYQNPEIYNKFSLAEDKEGKILKNIIGLCNPQKTRLLDIGSGTGKYVNLLGRYCKSLFALEPSQVLVDSSGRECKSDNIVHLLAYGESIPLPNNYIDIILATWATFGINDAFMEMMRVLRKGGKIIRVGAAEKDEFTSLFPDLNVNYFQDNNKWFENHGFRTKYIEIKIQFSDIKESKKILSEIIGIPSNQIKKVSFRHKVALQIFSK